MDFKVVSNMCLQKIPWETLDTYFNYFVTQEIQILRDCFWTNCSYASVFLSLNEDNISEICMFNIFSMYNVWLKLIFQQVKSEFEKIHFYVIKYIFDVNYVIV